MSARLAITLSRLLFIAFGLAALAKLTTRGVEDNGLGDHVMFYRASRAMLAGGDPYIHGYLYPPLLAFLMTPLVLLPGAVYSLLWGLSLGGLWIYSRRLIRGLLARDGREPHWAVDILPSVLLFRYIYNGWGLGQVVFYLVALVLLFLHFDRREKDAAAGFVLGFASAIKFFPAFVSLVLLARGKWRTLAWMAAFGALLTVLPVLETGPERFAELLREGMLGTASRVVNLKRTDLGHTGVIATAWFRCGLGPGTWLTVAELGWMLVCAALTIVYCPRPERPELRGLWLGLVLTSMLVAMPYLSKNYLTFLLLPFAAVIDFLVEAPEGARARSALRVGLVAATLLFNFYSPWLLGGALSAEVERAVSPIAMGLLVFWLALLRALHLQAD